MLINRRIVKRLVLVLVFALCVSALSAQDLELPLVISAKGKSFVIGNGGRSETYWTGQLSEERIRLSTDDMLQTGKGDFVQVALQGSDAILFLAESTSVIYTGNPAKQDTFTLVYGRMRIRSKGGRPITILNENTSITINGGDLNIDYIYTPSVPATQKPVLRLSAIPSSLKDNIVVLPKASDSSFGRLTLKPGETLLVDSFTYGTERIVLDNTIIPYWSFVSDPNYVATMGAMEWNPEPAPDEDFVGIRDFDFQQSTINLKTGGIITGLALILAGIAIQSSIYFMGDSLGKDQSQLIYGMGYLPIGIGSFTLLAAYFYKTPTRPNIK
ncbi:MAG: hypothetical protein LBT01_00745 [Spirochaetaceae bacterium]|jgi:hypothetical protein|nr:hypothetical protein [Spirochaetaceae bacterium]